MRILILYLLLFGFTASYAQNAKVNFTLKAAINKYHNQEKSLSIMVRGDVPQIKKEVLALGGTTGLSTGNIIQVKLLSDKITSFSAKMCVESIEYKGQQTRVLNDSLLNHNNVPPVTSGTAPLIDSYTGKGVVFGLIDTGIDIEHGDFQDSLGNTRIYRIWEQRLPDNGSSNHGYGLIWDSTSINNSTCTHLDSTYAAHGTHVTGIGAGNGLELDKYKGVAPDATIVVVSLDFGSTESIIVDAVDYIYNIADSLNMPCVINASIGDYPGSHDGTDADARIIDSLISYKSGRAFVCAAGNAGDRYLHAQHQVTSDTTFTWFQYNANSILGYGAVYYEVWSDTADFNNVNFSIGANLPSGSFGLRGNTPFDNIQNRLGNFTDTIKNNGNVIGIIDTYGELQGDKYLLQVHIEEPDSSSYYFSLMTTGSGKLDVWSEAVYMGTSNMVRTGLPAAAVYPNIVYYIPPDLQQNIVSSHNCLATVLSVGNYMNRNSWLRADSTVQVTGAVVGQIQNKSSIGPTRKGVIKPDVASTGGNVMSSTTDAVAAVSWVGYVGFGSKHRIKSGTSMSSPAVAGIVALYLEKCPNASMAEIRSAVISSAKQDTFTGATPNNTYGYGKADAFAALNTSNYNLTLGSDQDICDGDSVQINSPSFSSYQWSTGDTTQSIFIDTTNSVYVLVSNASGCKANSDTVDVDWHPLPLKPIITLIGNDTLLYATNLGMQWYFNTGAIVGETDTVHVALNDGDYYVQVIDSFGCVNNSDTIGFVGVGIEKLQNNSFSIYPNPTTGKVSIVLENNSVSSVDVINLLGELLQSKTVNGNQSTLELDITGVANGVYYIRINTDQKKHLQKLILFR